MTAREKAASWLNQSLDEETRNEIQTMLDGPAELLEDAFYKDLEFGTGGMRGVMGAGSNRVNRYTLGKATQGLANYLKKMFPGESLRVAIAHDSRNNSKSFSKLVADVLSANGIEVYLFSDLRPTPELSFAVRHLNCHSGIVITASHNPPEYNGYKVYWNDGAQIVAPHDKAIVDEVTKLEDLNEIKFDANESFIHSVDQEIDKAFIQKSLEQRINPSVDTSRLKIVFTSLHGTSITIMPELLESAGYSKVFVVEEQAKPDGLFPTVKSPNPEEREALDMALKLAEIHQADMVVGTDPDSDRLGIAVRNQAGEMVLLNGNQTGVLLTDYLLSKGGHDSKDFIAYTIVSTDLFADVAHQHNCGSEVCLTGFKNIAKLIRDYEGSRKFIGGGEESYGYMVGDFVRDKDALTSTLLFCDLASECIERGETVIDYLDRIYAQHGLYHERLLSITKKGKQGSEEIAEMMNQLRENPPAELAGERVIKMTDLKAGVSKDLDSGAESDAGLPASNVLQFFTENGSKICARPSGTEPKIKFYFSVKAERDPKMSIGEQQKILDQRIDLMIKDLSL